MTFAAEPSLKLALAPNPQNDSATGRLSRLLYFAVGAAGVAFAVLAFESFAAQVYQPVPAISYLSWGLVIGLPAAMCVLSHLAPIPVLRTLAASLAAVVLLDVVLWLVLRWEPLPAGADIPWIISLTGVPAVCVAILASRAVIVTYSLVVSILGGVLRFATTTYENPVLIGLEDAMYSLLMQSIMIGLTLATRRGAAALDDAARRATEDGARQAAQLGARQARLTMDALVHDSVMSTLLIAGRGRAGAGDLSRHSARTLAQLDEQPDVLCPDSIIPVAELERRLRELVDLAPHTVLRFAVRGQRPLPVEVVAAIEGAVGEAMRNSIAYAAGAENRSVARSVVVDDPKGVLTVVVHDDGVGFEPKDVPSERLGISQSILGRMHNVDGGAATVSSCPAGGTKVVISWTRS